MTTPKEISTALTKVSSKVFHFGWHNGYTVEVDKASDKFFTWNGRDTKVYDGIADRRSKAAEGLKDPASHAALATSTVKTAGWTVSQVVAGTGTAVTRGATGLAGAVVWFLARVPLGLVGTAVATVPLALAGGFELVHGGVLSAKATGRWIQARADQWKAISTRKHEAKAAALAAKAAEAPAVDGPALAAPVAEAPAADTTGIGAPTASVTATVAAPAKEVAAPAAPAVAEPAAPVVAAPAAPEQTL